MEWIRSADKDRNQAYPDVSRPTGEIRLFIIYHEYRTEKQGRKFCSERRTGS